MKIINIKEYKVKAYNEKNEQILIPFNIRESLSNIILARHNQWDGVSLLKASKIADKIIEHKKDKLILEDAEYDVLKQSIEKFTGYAKQDVEMVERVLNAQDYKLKK